VEEYIARPKYFGAVIGRVGTASKTAVFSIDGKSYAVTPTHPDGTSLHGGLYGFDTKAFAHAVAPIRDTKRFIFITPAQTAKKATRNRRSR
jgi:galactose mutarotase-like enzyme